MEDFGSLNSARLEAEANPVAAKAKVVPAPPPEDGISFPGALDRLVAASTALARVRPIFFLCYITYGASGRLEVSV